MAKKPIHVDPQSQIEDMEASNLDQFTATDTGGRHPDGWQAKAILTIAFVWAVFQLYIASNVPFWLTEVTGVNVTVQLDTNNPDELLQTVQFTRDLADEIRAEYPEIDVYLTGVIMLNIAFVEAAMGDMATLTPLMYLVVLVLMAFFLRSVLGTLATLLVIILATVAAIGAAGWMRMALTPQVAIVPTLVMTLAVADCVHVLTTLFESLRAGMDRRAAILESLRANFQPVFLTSITTV